MAVAQTVLRGRTRLVVFPLVVFVGGLTLLDIANWVGRRVWVQVLSLDTIFAYAPRIFEVTGAASADTLWYAVDPDRLALLGRSRPLARGLVALVLGGSVFGAFYVAIKDSPYLMGEPLLSLFADAPSTVARPLAAATHLPLIHDGERPLERTDHTGRHSAPTRHQKRYLPSGRFAARGSPVACRRSATGAARPQRWTRSWRLDPLLHPIGPRRRARFPNAGS